MRHLIKSYREKLFKRASLGLISSFSAAVALSGCVSLLPEPAPADLIYRLSPITERVSNQSGAYVVRIDNPIVAQTLQSQDIIVITDTTQIASASGAQWAETIPSLLQQSVIDHMGTRADMIGVLPTSGARPKYRVSLNIRAFEAQFDRGLEAAPLAVIDYTATVSNAATRAFVGVHDVRQTARARSERVSDIVKAKDQANAQAADDLMNWLAQSLPRYEGIAPTG